MLQNALRWLRARPVGQLREKPEELLYGFEERPPLNILLVIGFQHTLLVMMLLIYAVVAARSTGMDAAGTMTFATSTLFVLGISAILMGLRTRLTPGVPLINIPSPVQLATYIATVSLYGLGAAMGAIIVSNVLLIFLVPYLPRLRAFFPPEVIGVIVLMLGIELISGGVSRSVGLSSGTEVSLDALLVALGTLAGIIVASVWGSTRLRIMAVLLGAVIGVLLSGFLGFIDSDSLATISGQAFFAVPLVGLDLPMPEFVPMAILPYLLVELMGAMEQMASSLTIDKISNRKWRRADMFLVSRSALTIFVSNILHGAAGLTSCCSSSANIGLAHASGVMSRHVAFVAGIMMMLIAFLPVIAGLVVLTPEPVVGGILVYTAAFMIVAGMELILSRMLDMKRSFTVGLSIVIGSSLLILPNLAEDAPEWSRTILESGLIVGSLCAVGLNILFRIGIKKTARTELESDHPGAEISEFLEHHGKVWGAREEVIRRAGLAVGEVIEILRDAQAVKGPVTLTVHFDEVDVVCSLSYQGQMLTLNQGGQVDLDALLEDEDDTALEASMMQVSSTMITRLADRVRAFERGGTARVVLHFEH
ncbi:uracil-xanthine permease family protein [Fodinicurvata fenggangensis]|uniref:uracil-xanthine permease family protein n=1 Tax=Fodinicurvata fenggangensis TaxID=1121830 RepID=UPI0012DE92F2|nr:solute carrier family 23 protein [Fodinicurvata fenggangensis]